jgi:hypothetical protein
MNGKLTLVALTPERIENRMVFLSKDSDSAVPKIPPLA